MTFFICQQFETAMPLEAVSKLSDEEHEELCPSEMSEGKSAGPKKAKGPKGKFKPAAAVSKKKRKTKRISTKDETTESKKKKKSISAKGENESDAADDDGDDDPPAVNEKPPLEKTTKKHDEGDMSDEAPPAATRKSALKKKEMNASEPREPGHEQQDDIDDELKKPKAKSKSKPAKMKKPAAAKSAAPKPTQYRKCRYDSQGRHHWGIKMSNPAVPSGWQQIHNVS